MSNPDKLVHEMYALYQRGYSLAQVGAAFSRTRQAVFDIFKRRGLVLRAKKPLPFIVFDGHRYTPRKKDGYYRRTDGDRGQLHRRVWEKTNGPIPDGFDVHHENGDTTDNKLSNLRCLPKPEHTRLHNPRTKIVLKKCIGCGNTLLRREHPSLETPFAYRKRKTCSSKCSALWKRGKKRGSKMP